MKIDFDPIKNEKNIRERGIPFERVAEVDFSTALIFPATSPSVTWNEGCTYCASQRPRQASGSLASVKRMKERQKDMAKRKPMTDSDGEVRELTAKDMARFKPAAEVLPPSLRKKLGVRGPQKAPTKERITIRLSREVVERFRESGGGWQTRVDEALREWLKKHSSA